MSINIGPVEVDDLRPRIAVIGVGGAGGNAVANMVAAGVEGVEFIVANTDAQALNSAVADTKIQLGPEITGGLGAGARPEVGRAAAEETVREIEELLSGVNMCFIAAGMGGGTGTGAAPIIAETARRMGVLTVGVVTKPFLFEGARRMRSAEAGIEELQRNVDTLLVIPNQNLFLVAKADTTFKEAFLLADEVLQQGVRSITDLMVMPGLINLDFADVKSVMEEMGKAMMGTGEAEGPNRALEAAESAIANPLLDGVSMQGAKGVIISIIGGEDMKLLEVDEAANHIRELVDEDANIIWGSAFNPDLDGKIRVSVVATGIESGGAARPAARAADVHAALAAPVRPNFSRPAPATDGYSDAGHDGEVASGAHGSDGDANAQVFGRPSGFDFADDQEPVDTTSEEPLLLDDIIGLNKSQEAQDADVAANMHDDEEEVSWSFGGGNEPASPSIFGNDEGADGFDNGTLNLNDDNALDEGSPLNLSEDFAVADADADDDLTEDGDRDDDAPPVTRRRLFSGSGESKSGSTLFERMSMTNLARGSGDEEEKPTDDGDGGGDKPSGGSSLNIPRFLNRHNNQ